MKSFKNILLAALMVYLVSCEDHLDINQSPNESSTSTVELTLPVAQAGIATLVNLELALISGYMNQYWTQAPQCSSCFGVGFDKYTFRGFIFQSTWDLSFATVLSDLSFVRKEARFNNAQNYEAISLILTAFTYQLMVDIWDQVPFDEALAGNDGNLAPSYEEGAVVYDSLVASLDTAVDIIQTGSVSPDQDDLIFKGDMDAWLRFANTLKLRLYMRQVLVRPEVAQNGIQKLVTDGVIFLPADQDVLMSFEGSTFNQNPFFKFYFGPPLNGVIFTASETIISKFSSVNDPRIDFFFEPASTGPNAGQHIGIVQGKGATGGTDVDGPETHFSSPNKEFIAAPTVPFYLMTGFESLFLQAEAMERGLMPGDPKQTYDQAVIAAFSFAGYLKDAIKFIEPGGVYAYPDGLQSEKLRAIAMQKWMAMCQVQNVESWAETRRNDYFDFKQSIAGTGASLNGSKFPERALYPPTEIAANPNAVPNRNIGDPVWWRK